MKKLFFSVISIINTHVFKYFGKFSLFKFYIYIYIYIYFYERFFFYYILYCKNFHEISVKFSLTFYFWIQIIETLLHSEQLGAVHGVQPMNRNLWSSIVTKFYYYYCQDLNTKDGPIITFKFYLSCNLIMPLINLIAPWVATQLRHF